MSTVTYHGQPAIHKTRGAVPEAGTAIPYTVSKILWPGVVTAWLQERLLGTSLHVCCGLSELGDVRLDLSQPGAHVRADAARLPFADQSFTTVLCDPPYNGVFRWQHDMLSELARVARRRVIFQHWFLPTDRRGRFKKANRFTQTEVALWPPQTYFGRVQVITVMDDQSQEVLNVN